ncbi:hypothetical protein VOLCADRAFT_116933 [Volvox carteri f. nagariensis]|uniref:Uncharacterized protein n=1 Tax=Volvox carteri f. nagariensis TaxID=3068 RepID=D8TQT6_VOLCA|nr:uncharacterized protein VOLCADRAFT_116933 [Volvox carteri f. nagariensis]EFJ50211.1 hypothetical protein VOLCADRAFT_116933 [Volvox carteri f. nagariensis]|eukprot:XP_002948831.1 hypothetical protein VOLCADRAFT_116933 [Volvox carteri f. nagariensis]
MEAQIALVRSALHALFSAHDGATRKAADNWLQNFRNSTGSWQLCLALLSRPGLAEYEYHFAAHSLRLSCCKVPELLDANVLPGLAGQLAALLLASVGGGTWPVAGQLSSALAALAVRAVCWEPEALVPQLLSLLAPQGGAGLGGGMAVVAGGGGHAGAGGGVGTVLAAAVGAEATAVFAVLHVVAGLPEACVARAVSAHPQRKAQVAAALAVDATVVPLLRATVHSVLRRAGLQLLHAWSDQLGAAPRGLEHETELLSCLYEALAASDTATLTSECLCGLFTACTALSRDAADDGDQSDTSSSSSGMILGEAVAVHGGRGGGHRRANLREAAPGFRKPRQISGAAASTGGYNTGGRQPVAAAATAGRAAATGSPDQQLSNTLLLQQLLHGLQALLQGAAMVYREQQHQPPPPGSMEGCAFWSSWSVGPLMALLDHSNPEDTYLAQLMEACSKQGDGHGTTSPSGPTAGGGGDGGMVVLQSHLPLLAQLLTGLVSRAALGPEVAAAATADARDLPEEVRMVRRELGATMRDLVGLVGLGHVAAFLERMVSEHASQLNAAAAAAAAEGVVTRGGPMAPNAVAAAATAASWTRLESSLYAANVALCSGALGASVGIIHNSSNSSKRFPAGSPRVSNTPTAASSPAVDDAHVASIISTAAGAVVHPASSLKLAGTALTLVGGMAAWFSEHPLELARPLEAKLARNAATALNRLCVHGGCAALLLGRYAGWVDGLRSLLPGPEVSLRHKPAPGVDMTSKELLVASLMRLACSSISSSVPPPRQPHLQQQQFHHSVALLRQGPCSSGRDLVAAAAAAAATAPMSRHGSCELDGDGGGSSGGDGAPAPCGALAPQVLLQQLLASRVLASASELERLAAALEGANAPGTLQAHLQLWRINRQQQQQQQYIHTHHHNHHHTNLYISAPASHLYPHNQQPQQQLLLLHCQQHCPQPCHHHGHVHGQMQGQIHRAQVASSPAAPAAAAAATAAASQRMQLCQPGSPPELHLLGTAALMAALRLGGLAGMMLFIPAAGQVQDMGASMSGGRRGTDTAARGTSQEAAAALASRAASATEVDAAATAAVVSIVVQVIRAVWPNLMACLRSSASAAGCGSGTATAVPQAVADDAARGGTSLLLETCEGAHLLPAACSLVHGALLVVASPHSGNGGGGGSAAAELLSCAVCLLGLAHGTPPVPPSDQQLHHQQWPANLDWPMEPGAATWRSAAATGARAGDGLQHHRPPHYHQQQEAVRPLWHGPPRCILQLVLGCLPLCGKILAQQQQLQPQPQLLLHQLLSYHHHHHHHQQQQQPQQQHYQQQATTEGQATTVAEQAVRAACLVAQSACASLQIRIQAVRVGRPMGLAPSSATGAVPLVPLVLDSERVLHVVPVLQALLLHTPQALATSRELLEGFVAATVASIYCQDPEACRVVLDWTQLLLCTAAFAPPTAAAAAMALLPAGRAAGLLGHGAGSRRGGEVSAAGGSGGGLAALQARCLQVPGLERAFAGIASQLDMPCACCPPNEAGLVYTVAAAEAGLAGGRADGGSDAAAGTSNTLVATGSLGAVLVLSLMVAAAGAMPPDLLLTVSTCLHNAWQAMGSSRFRTWVRTAAVELCNPAGASAAGGMAAAAAAGLMPWSRLKPEVLTASLDELLGEECVRDVLKFKRSLKMLCGGKKKGGGGA